MVVTFETLVSLRRRYELQFAESLLSGDIERERKFFTRWKAVKIWAGGAWLMAGAAASWGTYPNGAEAMRISRGGVRR